MSAPKPEDILDLLSTLFHGLKSATAQDLREDGDEVAPMEARALSFVARHPGCTQLDIAQRSGRDKAQIARLVKNLLDRGLLERVADAADRRYFRLELTNKGRSVSQSVKRHRARLAARACADLSAAERATLAKLLERVAQRIGAAQE